MILDFMAWSGVGNFEFVDGIMIKDIYIGILQRNLPDSVGKLGLGRRYTFLEDNDPKLTAGVFKDGYKKIR